MGFDFKENYFTLSAVNVRMELAPQFWIRVLGIISIARATALYGHCMTPATLLAFSSSACVK